MKIKLLAFTLALAMFTTSCTTSWVSVFENYLAIAAPIAIQILEIIALAKGQMVSPAAIAKINGDAAAVRTLVQSLNTAFPVNVPNACAALNVGIATFAADVPTLEQIGQVSDPKLKVTIADALLIVQSTIMEIEAPITVCQTSGAKAGLVAAASVPSPSVVVSQWNSSMQYHEQPYRVHLHSWPVRYITLGIMK